MTDETHAATAPAEQTGASSWLQRNASRLVLTERSARILIALMLGAKLLLTVWNAVVYDARCYDYDHHAARALVGGLEPGKMNYDPPLYYLPALLFSSAAERKAAIELAPPELRIYERDGVRKRPGKPPIEVRNDPVRARLIAALRYTNILYLATFYLCWCYVSLPLLLRDWRSWFLACALLLSLPGYQKLGVMTHADNLFAATSAACVAIWLTLHARWQAHKAPLPARSWLALAFVTGLTGLSRPFAAVPVAVFSLIACVYAVRGRPLLRARTLASVLAIGLITGTMSVTWYAYRWAESKAVTAAYKEGYIAHFEPLRKTFDYVDYFTSFRIGALLKTPHRSWSDEEQGPNNRPSVSNSFFTLLYSETWGDHWLYFSGQVGFDEKMPAKRSLLRAALPLALLWLIGILYSARSVLARAKQAWTHSQSRRARWLDALAAIEPEVVLAIWLVLGIALYVYWQSGAALLPGKNSTVKFIYVATLYPLGIALACLRRPPPRWFELCSLYVLLLYVLAFRVALFLPT